VTGPSPSCIMPEAFELHVPTPTDFQGIAVLQTEAFHNHESSCFRINSKTEHVKNYYRTYERYFRDCPRKLQMCRIIRSPQDGTVIVAACQLMTRRAHGSDGIDVFVEWVACHPDQQGKGIGTQLLAWAANFAKEQLKVTVLSLFVVMTNAKARRLYEREGFVMRNLTAKQTSELSNETTRKESVYWRTLCGKPLSDCWSPFQCWSVQEMQKNLMESSAEASTQTLEAATMFR
jgi:ribosomal protein S18 acetylase RimI-like enzyme